MKTITTLTIIAAVALSTASVHADVFTDSVAFNGANPGLDLIDFEGVVADEGFIDNIWNLYAGQGVIFTPTSFSNSVINMWGANGFFENTSTILSTGGTNDPIVIGFSNQVTSVGFNVSNLDFVQFPGLSAGVTIEVFNGTTLLATETFDTATPDLMTTFIGFSDLGSDITSVHVIGNTVDPLAGVAQQFIDNLSFGSVPTPGSLAILGLGGLAAGRRRR